MDILLAGIIIDTPTAFPEGLNNGVHQFFYSDPEILDDGGKFVHQAWVNHDGLEEFIRAGQPREDGQPHVVSSSSQIAIHRINFLANYFLPFQGQYVSCVDVKAAADLCARVDRIAAIFCAKDGLVDEDGERHVLRQTALGKYKFFKAGMTQNGFQPIDDKPTPTNHAPLILAMRSTIALSIHYAKAAQFFDPNNQDFDVDEFKNHVPNVVQYVFALSAKPEFEETSVPKRYEDMGAFLKPFNDSVAGKWNFLEEGWVERLAKLIEWTAFADMPDHEVVKNFIPVHPRMVGGPS